MTSPRRFESRRDLRTALEAALGPVTEPEWAIIQPEHFGPYDLTDLRNSKERLLAERTLSVAFPDIASLFEPEPLRTLAARVRIAFMEQSREPTDFERVGRLTWTLALASERSLATRIPLNKILGALDPSATPDMLHWLESAAGDLTGTLAASAGWSKRAKVDWRLYFHDAEITRRLWDELIGGDAELLTAALRKQKWSRTVGPSAAHRWAVYESERVERGGRSFESAGSYRRAVDRARKGVAAFVARQQVRKEAGRTRTTEN